MFQEFSQHINTHFPFLKDKKLLVAVSGGLDSVVLYHLFKKLNYNIAIAHCNFKLRNTESDADEIFVYKLAQKSSNQIFTKFFDTKKYADDHKISIQIAARDLRYNWFQELCKEHDFDFIVTAHHANDNVETFLINFTRGTGLEGLTGIPNINQNIIRPLLPFNRQQILAYAKQEKLEWREDSSNQQTKYVRNKLRHDVVPHLETLNPNLIGSFLQTTQYLNDVQLLVDTYIEAIKDEISVLKNGVLHINLKKLKQKKHPKAILYQLLKSYHFTEWNDVYHLLDAQTGKQIFSKTHRLLKNRDELLLTNIDGNILENEIATIDEKTKSINHPLTLLFEKTPNVKDAPNSIFVDKDLLKYPLQLRKWQNGDYFYPSGMQGKKKLSKYFKDEKMSLLEKENAWVLVNTDESIIWIVNKRQDKRFLPTANSTNLLKITCLKDF